MKITSLKQNWNQLIAIAAFASFSLVLNSYSFAGGGDAGSSQTHGCGTICEEGECPRCKVPCEESPADDGKGEEGKGDDGKGEDVLCSQCNEVCSNGKCSKGHSCGGGENPATCNTDGGTCDVKGNCSKTGLPCGHTSQPPQENTCAYHGIKFVGTECPCGKHVYTQTPTDICKKMGHNNYCCNGICSGVQGGHPCNQDSGGGGGGGSPPPVKKALVIKLKSRN